MIGPNFIRSDPYDYSKTIFVAGFARAGTTWLAELINFKNDHRIIFEPFYKHRTKQWSDLQAKQYIALTEEFIAKDTVSKVLKGNFYNPWSARYKQNIFSKNIIVKEIRANHFLGWLKTTYPDMKMVVIFRNPYATINSINRSGFLKKYPVRYVFAQPKLIRDQFESQRPYLKSLKDAESGDSLIEAQAAAWCLEVVSQLKQLADSDSYFLHYEILKNEPEKELKLLFEYLEIKYEDKILEVLKKPSSTTNISRAKNNNVNWQTDLSDEKLAAIDRALKKFGVSDFYSSDGQPNIKAFNNFA